MPCRIAESGSFCARQVAQALLPVPAFGWAQNLRSINHNTITSVVVHPTDFLRGGGSPQVFLDPGLDLNTYCGEVSQVILDDRGLYYRFICFQ